MTEQDLDQTKAEALVKSMGVIPNDAALTPLIRAVSAGDKETLRRMFRRLSPQTIYRRFHTPYPSVPAWMLVWKRNLALTRACRQPRDIPETGCQRRHG